MGGQRPHGGSQNNYMDTIPRNPMIPYQDKQHQIVHNIVDRAGKYQDNQKAIKDDKIKVQTKMLNNRKYVNKLEKAHDRVMRGEFESYECQKFNTYADGFWPTKDGYRSLYKKDLEIKFKKGK